MKLNMITCNVQIALVEGSPNYIIDVSVEVLNVILQHNHNFTILCLFKACLVLYNKI